MGRAKGAPEVRSFFDSFALDETTGCWNWTGCKDKYGYSQLNINRKSRRVHRVLGAQEVSPIHPDYEGDSKSRCWNGKDSIVCEPEPDERPHHGHKKALLLISAIVATAIIAGVVVSSGGHGKPVTPPVVTPPVVVPPKGPTCNPEPAEPNKCD